MLNLIFPAFLGAFLVSFSQTVGALSLFQSSFSAWLFLHYISVYVETDASVPEKYSLLLFLLNCIEVFIMALIFCSLGVIAFPSIGSLDHIVMKFIPNDQKIVQQVSALTQYLKLFFAFLFAGYSFVLSAKWRKLSENKKINFHISLPFNFKVYPSLYMIDSITSKVLFACGILVFLQIKFDSSGGKFHHEYLFWILWAILLGLFMISCVKIYFNIIFSSEDVTL